MSRVAGKLSRVVGKLSRVQRIVAGPKNGTFIVPFFSKNNINNNSLKTKSSVIFVSNHCARGFLPTSPIFYFKLPYIGHFSVVTQKKIRHFIKRFCNDLDIKLVFSSFKIGNMFDVKAPIPGGLRSRVVLKSACAGCNACYVGETTRHFPHVCASTYSVIRPPMSSNIFRILNIVAPCVQ